MARRRTTRRPTKRRVSQAGLIVGLLILLALYLYQSGALDRLLDRLRGTGVEIPTIPLPGQPTSEGTTAGTGAIQAFFTTPTLVYPDKPGQRQPSPLLTAVIADIDAAQTSVDIASFDFDIPALTEALIRAQKRGITVRVIVDSENLITPEVSQQTGRLEAAGIAVHFDDREPFMHNKFIVVDETLAWTGSWNMTANDTYRNNNNMLRFASREIATDYQREFQQLFDGAFGTEKRSVAPYRDVQLGATRVQVLFSPEDGVAQYVVQRLEQAQNNIRFMAFSYTSNAIAGAMIARAQAGVSVKGVFEAQNAAGSGSAFNRLKRSGVDIVEDGNCYILHHKVILIDDRTVITGSYNFTGSAERDNDENLVIVDDPTLARAYLQEFERIYAQAQTPLRCR